MEDEHAVTRVEIDEAGRAVRIFRTVREAVLFEHDHPLRVKTMHRRDAVEEIRRHVFERSNGNCEWCGMIVSWKSMHLHEVVSRGDEGEISLFNSVAICAKCHIGPRGAHANRQWGGGPKNL